MSGDAGRPRRARTPQESALAAATRLLAYQSRTEAELVNALARRGHAPDKIDKAMADMKRLGYIDDEATAKRWAEHAAYDRRYGIAGVSRRLMNRGISPELAEQAAREAYDSAGQSEEDIAVGIGLRRIEGREWKSPQERDGEMRRLAGFLQRRGFSSDTIAKVLRKLF